MQTDDLKPAKNARNIGCAKRTIQSNADAVINVVQSPVVEDVISHLYGGGRSFIFCAEPDMGKTSAIKAIGSYVCASGGFYKYINLGQIDSGNPHLHIVSSCREVIRRCGDAPISLIAFDNVPYIEEHQRYKVARAVRKVILAGINVIIAGWPENDISSLGISDSLLFTADNFILNMYSDNTSFSKSVSNEYHTYTHGIPALVRSSMLFNPGGSKQLWEDHRYLSALAKVATDAFRPSLMREERLVRIAMIELGHGSLSEIEQVCGPVDPSLLSSIASDALFFGIDTMNRSFSCAGEAPIFGFQYLLSKIGPQISGVSAYTLRSCGVLVSRGDYGRAGALLMTCEPEARVSLVLSHPTEFIDAGYLSMVAAAASVAAHAGDMDAVIEARVSLGCAQAPSKEYVSLLQRYDCSGLGVSTRLLVDLRNALACGVKTGFQFCGQRSICPGTSRGILTAIRGLSLLQELRFRDAYSYLLGVPERTSLPMCLTSCLIWAEYFFAMGMSGNTPSAEDLSGFDRARTFAKKVDAKHTVLLLSASESLVCVFAGRGEATASVESCAQRAAVLGMDWLQSLCLIGSAVADQRAGAHARAYVRLGQAKELAEKSQDSNAKGVCHILSCAVRCSLGEVISSEEVLSVRMPTRLSMVARVFAAVVERPETVDLDVLGKIRLSSCPDGTSWLVHILANDYEDLSKRFADFAPRPWIDKARRAALAAGEFGPRPTARPAEQLSAPSLQQGYQLDISVLGGLSVSVNGVPIDESCLERRRAKSLLALLAAMPDHRAKRYEVMESIWPEYDYHDARQRVYEATSVLRMELTSNLGIKDVNPFISNRGAGTLGLHPTLVRCDVDSFECLARSVLSASKMRPSEVLDSCAKLEELYRGDLFVPQVDGAGMVTSRRDELRQLYADTMVLASDNALALGNVQVAVHYAENACGADAMREDAELCLIRALASAGRRLEAEVSYRSFTDRIVKEMKQPPSRKLREAYGELVAGGEDAGGRGRLESGATAATA